MKNKEIIEILAHFADDAASKFHRGHELKYVNDIDTAIAELQLLIRMAIKIYGADSKEAKQITNYWTKMKSNEEN